VKIMLSVLVIGGGLSGCTTAYELALGGAKVTVVEKAARIGGKVISYGCKATDKCNNCGVCLSGGLWEKVERASNIDIICDSKLVDLKGKAGDFSAIIKTREGMRYINNISYVVVAIGFDENHAHSGHLHLEGRQCIVRGLELETLCKTRSRSVYFEKAPKNVAFIQCVGSRDKKEDSTFCSRVCCGYSTRAAKVIRETYPDCGVTFFYMELQAVSHGPYFSQLENKGFEFIKCRPLKITGGEPAVVWYEDPESGRQVDREYDFVMLSDGIAPAEDAEIIAELCGLGFDENGFLRNVGGSADTGVYVSGCAKKPGRIEDTYSDSVGVANEILSDFGG
jgi:heterodisulfide reductase subunit A